MGTRCATTNLNLATALSTAGVIVSVDKMLDDPTGKQMVTFYMSPSNVENPEDFNPVMTCNEINGPLRFSTARLRKQIGDGTLEESDPLHPVLNSMRALDNREFLLSWMNRDERARLLIHRKAAVMFYRLGQEPFAFKIEDPTVEFWETTDLKLAASIALVGVPVAKIQDTSTGKVFVLPRYGYACGGAPIDAIALAKRYRSGVLAKEQPGHPLLWGIQTLKNRAKLLTQVKDQQFNVLIRNPKSGAWINVMRSAIVEEKATPAAFDDAIKHNRRV